MRGTKRIVLSVALWLSGQVGDSPQRCYVTWMFCLPCALLTHITLYFVHTDWKQIAQWHFCVRASRAIGSVWKSKVRVQKSCQPGVGAIKGEERRIRERFLWMSSVIILELNVELNFAHRLKIEFLFYQSFTKVVLKAFGFTINGSTLAMFRPIECVQ